MLFGDTYYSFHNFGVAGTPIVITGEWQRRFATSDPRFNIKNIQLMEHVKGKLVHRITVDLDTTRLSDVLRGLISDCASAGEGIPEGELAFRIFDPSINRSVRLSAGRRIHITRNLVEALEQEELHFTIND